ncbi:MAG: ferritin family protein [Burkholderiales bacterium]
MSAPTTLSEFMALAVQMELEAAARYAELADTMEVHNNREVAGLFRRMATIEAGHAKQVMADMGWTTVPALPDTLTHGDELPETAPTGELHYLMQPYQALALALECEQRAERFFARLAAVAPEGPVRDAAHTLHEEEREHVELMQAWMAKFPQPDADWADDPDPPRYTE